MSHSPVSTPAGVFDYVAAARNWVDTPQVRAARAYLSQPFFDAHWEDYVTSYQAEYLDEAATRTAAIQQPGARKLAYLFRQNAGNAEQENPDGIVANVNQFLDDVAIDARRYVRTGLNIAPLLLLVAGVYLLKK